MATNKSTVVYKKSPNWDWESIKPLIGRATILATVEIVNDAKQHSSGPEFDKEKPRPKKRRATTSTIKRKSRRKRKKKTWTKGRIQELLNTQKVRGFRVRRVSGRYSQSLDQVGQWTNNDLFQVAIGSAVDYDRYIEKNTGNITLSVISKTPEVGKRLFNTLGQYLDSQIKV